MATNYTTRQIAELLGVETWRIQRIFEDGDVSDVSRFAGKRVIPSTMLPQVIDALRDRGWLPEPRLVTVPVSRVAEVAHA